MPIEKCRLSDGSSGFRWGQNGKCYKNKKDALRQGVAEEGEAVFKKEMLRSKSSEEWQEMMEVLEEHRGTKSSYTDSLVESMGAALSGCEAAFAAEHDEVFAKLSTKQRDDLPDEDFAWPEARKYPIKDQDHLDAAVKLLGRAPAEKQGAIKKRIISIAKRKGLRLPDDWTNN